MITTRISGGMGNQMFEYAAARALALKHGTEVVLDLTYLNDRTWRPKPLRITFRKYDLDIFNVQARFAARAETPLWFFGKAGLFADMIMRKALKPRGTEKHFHYDPDFWSYPDGTYLDGTWQSPKYFAGYEDQIRADFSFKDEQPEATQAFAAEIRAGESVCVHVRRADFVGHSLHDICDAAYYARGIAEIASRGAIGKIYVFSDDIAWCRDNVRFEYPTEYVSDEYSGKKNGGHLFLMSQCKYFVIANSSFSWWSAWLSDRAGKVVVAPKRWLRDESIDTSDIYPEDWIRT